MRRAVAELAGAFFGAGVLVAVVASSGCEASCEDKRDCGPYDGPLATSGTDAGGSSSQGGGGSAGSGGAGGCDMSALQTDPLNCGVCGHSCLGGLCTAGKCQPFAIADGIGIGGDIAVSDGFVYWTDQAVGSGAVDRTTLDGALGVEELTNALTPNGLAVAGNSVVYAHSLGEGAAAVSRVATTGGQPTRLAEPSTPSSTWAVATDGTVAVFTDLFGTVGRTAITGSNNTFTALASGEDEPRGVAIDNGIVYFVTSGNGLVRSVPVSGGAVSTVASPGGALFGIDAVDGTLVWTDQTSGSVVIKSGALPPTTLATGLTNPFDVTIDAQRNVAYVTELAGRVLQVALNGGEVTVLGQGFAEPYGVASDATAVYFTTDSRVWRVAKPPQ